jgi:hypothetical protein
MKAHYVRTSRTRGVRTEWILSPQALSAAERIASEARQDTFARRLRHNPTILLQPREALDS